MPKKINNPNKTSLEFWYIACIVFHVGTVFVAYSTAGKENINKISFQSYIQPNINRWRSIKQKIESANKIDGVVDGTYHEKNVSFVYL